MSERPRVFRAGRGHMLHLHVPGYHVDPGGNDRMHALCHAPCSEWSDDTVWYDEPPLAVPAPDPFPLRWCPRCVGLALDHLGCLEDAVEGLRPSFTEGVTP